ncbi:NADPH-dependent diflavin oxidoreductase 1 [Phtheirospermum japonicum]|uniref:NADPH-dependent diflavin oxidoreductase 1 n=1 Tax=Phtheirospermum japonicum TaxID=374723 RepID=A0A830BM46_9LAMI|nr:NADPH-dependent diflavin oxidoreductase 1 [Phtheirospermum japonicum]
MGSVEEKPDNQLLILCASQTGNAVDAAERLGREAERRGCPSVSVLSIDEFQPSDLPNQEAVIFVVSTTGQGENPDSMKGFWRFLLQKNLTREWLEGVNYAVFGLGDSSYQKYNFVAKKLDKRLSDLGAMAIIERGLGDDQHPSGLNYRTLMFVCQTTRVTDLKDLGMQIERARSMTPGKFSGKNQPDCFLKMTKNHLLSRADSGKDVRHMEFEAVSSSIDYEVGGVLEILPGQSPAAVDAFIQRCNLDPESYITVAENNYVFPLIPFQVQPRDKENHGSLNPSSFPMKLKSFVELTMDVASASPRRYIFEVMSYFATAEHEKERLQYFASPEGRDDLYQYNQKERRTVLEVLEDFPSVQMPLEWLVQLVPPLKTRAFSISSSHSAHPNQVHLTVSVVSWTTPYKRKRAGVFIPAWFSKGSLPAPPPSLPLILIGPGTGCAPFRGFVEERALQSKTIPTAPILFFFGCRNEKDDFLYRDFWSSHSQNNGVLSEDKGGGFHVAFSRAQPQKVYVQHKIRENSKRIWSLLTQGAAVYVAGSANKMPSDVLLAFEEIVSRESGVSRGDALRWIRTLEKAGKYHVEAWS